METGLCVNSRSRGGASVQRKRIPRVRNMSKITTAVLLAIGLFAGSIVVAAAAPQATQFMPGFPLIAGENVMVMWLPVPGGVKYILYLNDKKVAEGPYPPLQIPTPAEGGEHRLQISAVDAAGAEGPKSPPSIIKVLKLASPQEPEARYMNGTVALRWVGSPAAVIYNVFRSVEKGKGYKLISSTQMSQYSDSDLAKDTQYYYVMTAKDITGKESPYSKEVAVSTKVEAFVGKEEASNVLKLVPTRHIKEYVLFGSQSFQAPVDIVSYQDKLFVLNGGNGTIIEIAKDTGDFVAKFGGALSDEPEAKVGIGFGLGVDRRGRLYLCAGDKVVVFGDDRKVVHVIKPIPPVETDVIEAGRKESKGRTTPSVSYFDMAETADGSILLVDNGFARFLILDPDTWKVKKTVGKWGAKPGEMNHPGFAAVNKNGDIWINDSQNRRGQIYKADYTHKQVAGEAKSFVGSFLGLGGAATDAEGNFLVTDPPMATIQVFSGETGKYLHHLAEEDLKVDPGNPQRPLWRMTNPAGIWLDPKTNLIYICSTQTNEILVRQIIKAKGGEPGSAK